MAKRDRRYWVRLIRLFIVTLTGVLLSLPFLIGVLSTVGLLYAPCSGSEPDPAAYGYGWEDVTIQARAGGSFRAYYIPGQNGATIIVAPALAAPRGGRWSETLLLLQNGYGILTFESRRCAGMGPLSLGFKEIDEVADALDYLRQRADVDLDRIGVYGFSQAGATALMATARLPDIKAVVAEGGYGDFRTNAVGTARSEGLVSRYFEWGYSRSFSPTYRLITGLDLAVLSPVSVIDQISPRPILLIYGSHEVSLSGAYAQLAAAGENAELWVVEGAGHGNYLAVAGEKYEMRLVGFLDEALLP